MPDSEGELIPCPAVVKPVLSRADWEKVQMLQQKYYPRKEKFNGRKYLLSGLVRCGYCGGIMKPQANRKGRADKYYICQRHAECLQVTPCRGSALIDTNDRQFGLEPLIAPFGMLYFLHTGVSFERIKLETQLCEKRAALKNVSRILDSIRKTLEGNFMLFETVKSSLENAGRQQAALHEELKMLEKEVEALPGCGSAERVATHAAWAKLPIERRQKIMREVLRKVAIFEDHYELELYNRDIISIPKMLIGKRFFNPELRRAEFNENQSQLRISIRAHDSREETRAILYKESALAVSYGF